MRILKSATFLVLISLLYWALLYGVGAYKPSPNVYALKVTGIAFWLGAAWVAQALLATIVFYHSRHFSKNRNKLPKLLIEVGSLLLFFAAGLLIVSNVFNEPLTGILATSGVFAAVLGLALQRTISELVSGIALHAEQRIKIGDWITITISNTSAEITGQVREMSLRSTELVTTSGTIVIVPNTNLTSNQFTNISALGPYFKVKKRISIDHTVPTDRVCDILQSAMLATRGVMPEPKPQVLIEVLDGHAVTYNMDFWVRDYGAFEGVASDVLAHAVEFLDCAGYSKAHPRAAQTTNRVDWNFDVRRILGQAAVLGALDSESLENLASRVHVAEHGANEVIVHEGDAGQSLFVVVTGRLEASKALEKGTSKVVGSLEPGDVFGEMSLFTGTPRIATVTTCMRTNLIEISKAAIEPIFAEKPEAVAGLSRIQGERLAKNAETLATLPAMDQAEIVEVGLSAFLRRKIEALFSAPKALS